MNTQPPRQHEVLSDEERELARVVRALPGGGPPAALDALILKAASDAVASSHSQKNSRWTKGLLGTSALWIGTAAASILTIGLGWQVFQSMGAPIDELPDSENVMSKQEIDSDHKSDTVTVEMMPAREPIPTSPPPPPLAESQQAQDLAAASDAAAPEKARPTPPEMRARDAFAREEMADASVAKKTSDDKFSERRDQAKAEADWVPPTAGAVASVAAPAPAAASPPAPAASANDSESKGLNAVVVTGSRIKGVNSESSQPVQVLSRAGLAETAINEDAKLRPDLWLDAIKDRVERDDIDGAKASLKLYKKTHPKLRIPDELKFLLK